MFRLSNAEKTNYTITKMAALLEVSGSGYYKWLVAQVAGPSPSVVRRGGLDAKVAAFHAASDEVYSSPRILADLREDGETVSRKTVAASMRRQHLRGISPGKFTPSPRSPTPGGPPRPTWSNARGTPGSSTGAKTSDITCLATG